MNKERKIILYIATSSDGFIAQKNGSVDWLEKYHDSDLGYGYNDFLKSIDIVIVGNSTQKQYPQKYEGKTCYVFSRTVRDNDENLIYVSGDIKKFIEQINPKGNIWLVGGAELVNQFIRYNLIDEYIITVVPDILGKGIPLFNESDYTEKLQLIETKYSGDVVQMVFKK